MGGAFFPLVRKLYSNQHPTQLSQNLIEEQVIWSALAVVGEEALLVSDRGLRRKALLLKLRRSEVDMLIRLTTRINVTYQGQWINILQLAQHLAMQGIVYWKPGTKRAIPCQFVTFSARLLKPKKRKKLYNPDFNFIVLLPLVENRDPLLLVTTLPLTTLTAVEGLIHIFERRWAVETSFEDLNRHLHLDEFMVQSWQGIERLLWLGHMAYMLLLLMWLGTWAAMIQFRTEIQRLLHTWAVEKDALTVGKLHEALRLDFGHHRLKWLRLLAVEFY